MILLCWKKLEQIKVIGPSNKIPITPTSQGKVAAINIGNPLSTAMSTKSSDLVRKKNIMIKKAIEARAINTEKMYLMVFHANENMLNLPLLTA